MHTIPYELEVRFELVRKAPPKRKKGPSVGEEGGRQGLRHTHTLGREGSQWRGYTLYGT
jgi:hypothetical protein